MMWKTFLQPICLLETMASIPMCGTAVIRPAAALLFARKDDFFPVVMTAARAHPVRLTGASTVAADVQSGLLQLPVGAPLPAARARVSSLGNRHGFDSCFGLPARPMRVRRGQTASGVHPQGP